MLLRTLLLDAEQFPEVSTEVTCSTRSSQHGQEAEAFSVEGSLRQRRPQQHRFALRSA